MQCLCSNCGQPHQVAPGSKTPKTIVVERAGTEAHLIIDGVEFPWNISAQVVVDCASGDMPSVTITLIGDQVLVSNRLGR